MGEKAGKQWCEYERSFTVVYYEIRSTTQREYGSTARCRREA